MFTGLIETRGYLRQIIRQGGEARLWIEPGQGFGDLRIGESVSVNGACLTVETREEKGFSAYASAETLTATNLGRLRKNDALNLERSLAVGDRLDGHFVTGHVDCLGRVESLTRSGESRILRVAFDREWSGYIVDKGSVAVDGVSLTVIRAGSEFFEVNLVPASLNLTALGDKGTDWLVNLEFDILGKYVARLLSRGEAEAGDRTGGISWEFLQKHGYQ